MNSRAIKCARLLIPAERTLSSLRVRALHNGAFLAFSRRSSPQAMRIGYRPKLRRDSTGSALGCDPV